MDDTYLINVAKTQFREGYNHGDVEQVLRLFEGEGFTDMSEGAPSNYGKAAREVMREHLANLFAQHSVRLTTIIIDIVILGSTAYDYGWHEFILTPKDAGETVRRRQRYFEIWQKNSSGNWRISLFINNDDVREELAGQVSHWFLSEKQTGSPPAAEA